MDYGDDADYGDYGDEFDLGAGGPNLKKLMDKELDGDFEGD
jgi:hypothetical protein